MTRRTYLNASGAFGAALLAGALLLPGGPAQAGNNEHTVVPERVYRSAQPNADELEKLIQSKGLKTVISLRGGDEGDRWFREETEVCKKYGVEHVRLGFSATRMPDATEMQRLLQAFDTAQYPVLIHCRAGSDRTGMAAAVYLSIYNGIPVSEARRKQLSLKFGHFAIGPAGAMDRFFKLYGKTADGQDLRTWILTRYPELRQRPASEERQTQERQTRERTPGQEASGAGGPMDPASPALRPASLTP